MPEVQKCATLTVLRDSSSLFAVPALWKPRRVCDGPFTEGRKPRQKLLVPAWISTGKAAGKISSVELFSPVSSFPCHLDSASVTRPFTSFPAKGKFVFPSATFFLCPPFVRLLSNSFFLYTGTIILRRRGLLLAPPNSGNVFDRKACLLPNSSPSSA